MDLAAGAKKVIVAMEHSNKDGKAKIVEECTFPLTAKNCVDLIVTDIAVIEITADGLLLTEVAPGWSPENVQEETEAILNVSSQVREIEL